MTARGNSTADASFNPVLTNDCAMTVKAAYGADGIYLLYMITDDNDVAWPNEFAGTENEQFYLDFDVVDVLMDSRSVDQITSPEHRDMLVDRAFGMTFTTRQYQIACGTEKEGPAGFRRSLAEPWDFNATYYTFQNAKSEFGLQVENVKVDYYEKAQEWFIPWSEYGGGFASEPDAGTHMGFSPGYNDRDEGEHFPPGRTSSGGSVKASDAIRWIGRTNPWGSSKPPYAWGEIELGSMLKYEKKSMIKTTLDLIKHTPLIRLDKISGPSVPVFTKVEFMQPGGSIKDRAALQIIIDAYIEEKLTKGQSVVEMTRVLSSEQGLNVGYSSGANVAAALKYAKLNRGITSIATILCDTGFKYNDL